MTVSRRALLGNGVALAVIAACSTSAPPSSPTASGSPPTRGTTSPRASAEPATTAAGPSPFPSASGPATDISRGAGIRPEVALTFHGAGDALLARQALAALAAADARATVFAVGTWLAGQPGLAREYLAAGHELGNHTWSHPTLSELGRAAARIEIERCRDTLMSVTGSPGAHFRSSGGQRSTPLIRELADAAGYRACVSYDIDSLDWTDPGPSAVRRNTGAAAPGSIVSLHLGHPGTVAALPAILNDLRGRGLHLVTVTELLRP